MSVNAHHVIKTHLLRLLAGLLGLACHVIEREEDMVRLGEIERNGDLDFLIKLRCLGMESDGDIRLCHNGL